MYFELKENKPHGTKDDPFSTYHIKNEGRSFQIPVHWHDELEIIYVKSGFLTVSISGENYIGTPGDAFVVSPGNLHFMGSQAGEVDYFTFLFPLEYISFCTDDMLDDKLLTPLKNGHLMIRPRIKDAAKELCEQLAEIYMAKNDEKKLEIAVQIIITVPGNYGGQIIWNVTAEPKFKNESIPPITTNTPPVSEEPSGDNSSRTPNVKTVDDTNVIMWLSNWCHDDIPCSLYSFFLFFRLAYWWQVHFPGRCDY